MTTEQPHGGPLQARIAELEAENVQLKEVASAYTKAGKAADIAKSIFELIEATHKTQEAKMTRICLVNITDGKEEDIPLVSLWAGVGDTSPIERISQLREENTALKQQVKELQQSKKVYRDGTIQNYQSYHLKQTLKVGDVLWNQHYSERVPLYRITDIDHNSVSYQWFGHKGDIYATACDTWDDFAYRLRISNYDKDWFIQPFPQPPAEKGGEQ